MFFLNGFKSPSTGKKINLSKSLKTLPPTSFPPSQINAGIQTLCTTSLCRICNEISNGLIQAHWVNGATPMDVSGKIPTHSRDFWTRSFMWGKIRGNPLWKGNSCVSLYKKVHKQTRLLKNRSDSQVEITACSSICSSALFTHRQWYYKFRVVAFEIIFPLRIYQQPAFCPDYSRKF